MHFEAAFERMMEDEGGYTLHQVEHDTGGQTYAGISRRNWPLWRGWAFIDKGEVPPKELVLEFYKEQFWDKLNLDGVTNKDVAVSIFNFAVNAGHRTATMLAQRVVGVEADGSIGPITTEALNAVDDALFVCKYALAKISFYQNIVRRNPTQQKFLMGWINRSLKGLL